MSHYKTNHPNVLAAFNTINVAYGELQESVDAFRDQFGAKKCLFLNGITDIRFGGLIFEPMADIAIWTKPDRERKTQAPRSRISGLTPEAKAEHKELLAKWNATYPRTRIDIRPLYESFGSDWGNCLMNGIGYFEGADGFIYVFTRAKLAEHMQSIPEWEHEKAKAERPSAGGAA